jgi:hypothetical protein
MLKSARLADVSGASGQMVQEIQFNCPLFIQKIRFIGQIKYEIFLRQ